MINFPCSQCGKQFNVADESAGKKAKCLDCGEQLRVPSPPAAPPVQKPLEPSMVADLLNVRLRGDPRPAEDAAKPKEPWQYAFLEKAAGGVWSHGIPMCLLGFALSMLASCSVKEPGYVLLLMAFSVLAWGLIYFSLVVWSAVMLVLVEGGRNLRAMRESWKVSENA